MFSGKLVKSALFSDLSVDALSTITISIENSLTYSTILEIAFLSCEPEFQLTITTPNFNLDSLVEK